MCNILHQEKGDRIWNQNLFLWLHQRGTHFPEVNIALQLTRWPRVRKIDPVWKRVGINEHQFSHMRGHMHCSMEVHVLQNLSRFLICRNKWLQKQKKTTSGFTKKQRTSIENDVHITIRRANYVTGIYNFDKAKFNFSWEISFRGAFVTDKWVDDHSSHPVLLCLVVRLFW